MNRYDAERWLDGWYGNWYKRIIMHKYIDEGATRVAIMRLSIFLFKMSVVPR